MADVRIDGISKYFGDFGAVKEVSTVFEEGTVTVLLGPSGCGKTTLMRMIVGLETPTTGSVMIGDTDVTRVPTNKRQIGMVFQYPVIYRGTTVSRISSCHSSPPRWIQQLARSESMRWPRSSG